MAVYEHVYRRYSGALTSAWQRFLVVPRYALAATLQSRAFIIFYLFCFVPPFVFLLLIYLRHNVGALAVLGVPAEKLQAAIPVDGRFFYLNLEIQGFLSFILAVAIGPALISPDLRNNGLALYLSRPFSRNEYLLGKLSFLVALTMSITCLPGLVLYLLQGYLEGGGWYWQQRQVVSGLVLGGGVVILAVSLLVLAVSAWVKWRPVARIVLLMLYFVMMGFAGVTELAIGTWWGGMLSISEISKGIWANLLGAPPPSPLPVAAAWFSLVALGGFSFLLLRRRVRAYEVVR